MARVKKESKQRKARGAGGNVRGKAKSKRGKPGSKVERKPSAKVMRPNSRPAAKSKPSARSKAPAKSKPSAKPKSSPTPTGTRKQAAKAIRKAKAKRDSAGTARGGRRTAKVRPAAAPPAKAIAVLRIRDLDPLRKCGPGTSVERLIRVDTAGRDGPEAHLIYLDRHGWYCEHGRACHAVGHARRHAREHDTHG